MFRPKTLFVVGAGASKEVNIPIGTELAEKISRLLYFEFDHFGSMLKKGDFKFFNALNNFFKDREILNSHLKAARQISEGLYLANSIDNYIDTHQHDSKISLCGKTAIVHTILKAEQNSSLFIDKTKPNAKIHFESIEATWYVKFAKILFEQVPLDKIDNLFSNIAIVCFNYDRCIQQILINAISALYSIPLKRAQKLVGSLKIFHPYGSIGDLPIAGSTDGIDFGQSTDHLDIISLSKSIKTYTEQIEESKLLRSLRQEVAEAETIVFLGFGFNPQNMNILTPTTKTKTRRVYATAFKLSKPDSEAIESQIFSTLTSSGIRTDFSKSDIQVRNDLTCNQLLADYQRTLATY